MSLLVSNTNIALKICEDASVQNILYHFILSIRVFKSDRLTTRLELY